MTDQRTTYYIKAIGDRFAMMESGTDRLVFWLRQRHVTFEMNEGDCAYVTATFFVVKGEVIEVEVDEYMQPLDNVRRHST